jgi:hypothetical protein
LPRTGYWTAMGLTLRGRVSEIWRQREFRRFWTGETISMLGSSVTIFALPLVAVITLHATPGQMGVLRAIRAGPGPGPAVHRSAVLPGQVRGGEDGRGVLHPGRDGMDVDELTGHVWPWSATRCTRPRRHCGSATGRRPVGWPISTRTRLPSGWMKGSRNPMRPRQARPTA